MSIDVSVTDSEGRPVDDLRLEDFELLDNGTAQSLRYFGPVSAPYHVYLLLDASGSTDDQRPFMLSVVGAFLGSIRSQDRISIGIFGEEVRTLVQWDDSHDSAGAGLREWTAADTGEGVTRLYRALKEVLERGFRGIDERRAVIVLTDGRDVALYRELQQNGRLLSSDDDDEFRKLYEVAGDSGVSVYFVAMNTSQNLDPNAPGNEYRSLKLMYPDSDILNQYLDEVRTRMEAIASRSGGEVLLPADVGDVTSLFERIGDTLGHAYSIGWTPRSEPGSPTTHSLEVRIPGTSYRIRQSRKEYLPR